MFSAYYFLKLHLHNFSKIKSQKESQNSRSQGFSYYFCIIEGSGSIPLTSGSGSGRPKNMWIRIRSRIRNTGILCTFFFCAGATLCWEPCWAPASCAAGAGRRQGASSSVPRLREMVCPLAASQPPPSRMAPLWRKMLRQGYADGGFRVFCVWLDMMTEMLVLIRNKKFRIMINLGGSESVKQFHALR
jgi:hypothetical protein